MSVTVLLLALQVTGVPVRPASIGRPEVSREPEARAVRRDAALSLDGDLGDPVWAEANPFTRFLQRDPAEGSPATVRTEVRVLFDDEALYVGARMFDPAPDSIVARLARRDAAVSSDRFTVYLDPYLDKRTGFYFGVSAAGTLYDGTLENDEWNDDTWDGIWEAKVRRDRKGWSVEMRIPYSQLRFRRKCQMIWGVNFSRDIARRNESDALVYTPKNGSGFVSRFIELRGIDDVRPPRRLEVTPYVTSRAEFLDHPARDPFNDGSRLAASTGADLKLGFGSNLTLDATVNPDFGQVEVDPAVVNLTDFETFYPEKRPFFIEGSSIFGFGGGGANHFPGFNWSGADLFYSRRIGRVPQGGLPGHDYADVPTGTTILGAAKLSGKITPGWSLGVLNAFTAREYARIDSAGVRTRAEVEPFSWYGLFRTQREYDAGRHAIGFMGTGTIRGFDNPALRSQLNHDAFTLGMDGWTSLGANADWVLTGLVAGSRVSGTPERMVNLQQSSARYFQRPDATHLSVDSAATSLTGWFGRVWLNKQRGDWIANFALGVISPGFETNDLGFLSRADVINTHALVGRRWTTPGSVFHQFRLRGAAVYSADFQGNHTGGGVWASWSGEFRNFWWLYGRMFVMPERINPRLTRGGPVMVAPVGHEWGLGVESNHQKKLTLNAEFDLARFQQGLERSWSLDTEIRWRPISSLSLSLEPAYSHYRTSGQYVGTHDDPVAYQTFGHRYLFADLDQTTVSASLRLNWTFTPTLSLELYAQPLLSSGRYTGFKELARPRSYRFNRYGQGGSTIMPQPDPDGSIAAFNVDPDGAGPAAAFAIDNPNFSYASLRGNAVLRWEYSAGSTLYLVWTQAREQSVLDGEFEFGRSLNLLGDARANNIFAVKMTYWWHP